MAQLLRGRDLGLPICRGRVQGLCSGTPSRRDRVAFCHGAARGQERHTTSQTMDTAGESRVLSWQVQGADRRSGRLRRFRGTHPISSDFGFDRGTPIDRYYIAKFLSAHAADIKGRALEVGDAAYCTRFGAGMVTTQDVFHVLADAPGATIVGDLSQGGVLPEGAFDCLLLTQMLHLIYDMRAAVTQMHRALRPGGSFY